MFFFYKRCNKQIENKLKVFFFFEMPTNWQFTLCKDYLVFKKKLVLPHT